MTTEMSPSEREGYLLGEAINWKERAEQAEQMAYDLRLFLRSALTMLADEPPYCYQTIGTPWWDGAVKIAELDEASLPNVVDVRAAYEHARVALTENGETND